MNASVLRVREHLFSMQDLKYRDFHSRLMPTVEKERVIGVRTPQLKKLRISVKKGNKNPNACIV